MLYLCLIITANIYPKNNIAYFVFLVIRRWLVITEYACACAYLSFAFSMKAKLKHSSAKAEEFSSEFGHYVSHWVAYQLTFYLYALITISLELKLICY